MRTTVEAVQLLLARTGLTFTTQAIAQAIADAEHTVAQYDLAWHGLTSAYVPYTLEDSTADFSFVVPGTNAQQTITVTNATGGTFTLTFRGQTTTAIPYNATAAQIQSALEALSTIGVGNVSVTGSNPWTVEFIHELGGQPVEALVATSALSGPGAAVTVTVTVAGAIGARVFNETTNEMAFVLEAQRTRLSLHKDIFLEGDPYRVEDVRRIEKAERYKAASLLVDSASGAGAGISSAALGPMRVSFGRTSQSVFSNEFEDEFVNTVGVVFA